MNASAKLIQRLDEKVRRRDRELGLDAALKASLGVLFSFLTFGFLFWLGWFAALMTGAHRLLDLDAWEFGAIVTLIFFVAATWSAWRPVDTLAGAGTRA